MMVGLSYLWLVEYSQDSSHCMTVYVIDAAYVYEDTGTSKPDGKHSRSNDTEEEELWSWKVKAIRFG